MNNVAGQVALNVGMLVLGGGRAGGLGMSNFSKTDLAGEPIEALQGNALAVNPAISDLNEALSKVATRIYSARAAQSHAEALTDGSTPEEIEKAGIVQAEADTPLYAGAWHLVYENLSGNDELFRLRFGAELGHAGFMRPPQACGYQSEPIAWTRWQADDWKVLREERAKAVGACAEVLGAAPEKFW
ncbi:MAG: hypothetical protein JSS56_15910 [Proteobacteria bacterium]|nr:hypothetical protein [Pseudomonadota bacterium]